MKFVFYKNGKKYTVTNVEIYEIGDAELSQFIITSTKENFFNELTAENRLLYGEEKEGIGWNNETIN
jgi:hypothetical protein